MSIVKRGEIYYADLSPVVGSEQGGMRPVQMRPSAGEFNFEVQHTSKVKDIHSFPLFLRRPETGKFLGITSFPPVNGLGGGAYLLTYDLNNQKKKRKMIAPMMDQIHIDLRFFRSTSFSWERSTESL